MTRYDDLKPLVESWRAASSALYRDAQILPAAVAQRLRDRGYPGLAAKVYVAPVPDVE